MFDRFSHLMNEVDCIRTSWGYGLLEALQYIADHRAEYEGTQVIRELREFMQLGAEMFAPVE